MKLETQAIGGYFELELPYHEEYHSDAIALNTGRNCLEYILRVREYNHVYLPYYTCDAIIEPFKKLGVSYSFYKINIEFELTALPVLNEGESLLYINYFGLKQEYASYLASIYGNQLIVDNTQAFFAKPILGIDTFYSCRKFFGVPDGAYLYCDKELNIKLDYDVSWERASYLLKRIDVSAEAAYQDFCSHEKMLSNCPIKKMSLLTSRIIESIDYDSVLKKRRSNYQFFAKCLDAFNGISFQLSEDAVPMVYPFFTKDTDLREKMIKNKIYVAKYWPTVLELRAKDTIEYCLTQNLLPIPIDQRYGIGDIKKIIKSINS